MERPQQHKEKHKINQTRYDSPLKRSVHSGITVDGFWRASPAFTDLVDGKTNQWYKPIFGLCPARTATASQQV